MAKAHSLTWAVLTVMLFSGICVVNSYGQSSSVLGTASAAPISINGASAEEMQIVPGIGQVIAERIVEYRDSNGAFEVLEDLMDVRGIGQVKFERIKNQITL